MKSILSFTFSFLGFFWLNLASFQGLKYRLNLGFSRFVFWSEIQYNLSSWVLQSYFMQTCFHNIFTTSKRVCTSSVIIWKLNDKFSFVIFAQYLKSLILVLIFNKSYCNKNKSSKLILKFSLFTNVTIQVEYCTNWIFLFHSFW